MKLAGEEIPQDLNNTVTFLYHVWEEGHTGIIPQDLFKTKAEFHITNAAGTEAVILSFSG